VVICIGLTRSVLLPAIDRNRTFIVRSAYRSTADLPHVNPLICGSSFSAMVAAGDVGDVFADFTWLWHRFLYRLVPIVSDQASRFIGSA
jgi:hypothetical protein